MTDIDKIRKINEMSQALKDHGFAESSEEAALQAKKVFNENIADVEKADAEKKEEKCEEEGGKEMAGNEEVDKIKRNFDTFKSTTQGQLDSMKGELSSLVGKMNEMIKAINELEKLKDSVTTIDEGSEKQQRLAPKVVKKSKDEKPSAKSHPRSGQMEPGDIDISETFYYGTK